MKTPMQLIAEAKAKIKEVSTSDFMKGEFKDHLIIDVREPQEHLTGNINQSVNIPRGLIEFEVAKHCGAHGLETPIVLYCKSGGRSALAATSLLELGYLNVVSLAGGFDAWRNESM